ncbi:hypothetical protein [Streptomyces sp. NPDC026659]|uniref:hypothetical protein n=1 Tax=Streptomyces sp. NPDC026659 TaxID=3155123 RepID=UPI0033DBAC80
MQSAAELRHPRDAERRAAPETPPCATTSLHGIWSENALPPSLINPSDSGSWQSESDGFMTGTEGLATI